MKLFNTMEIQDFKWTHYMTLEEWRVFADNFDKYQSPRHRQAWGLDTGIFGKVSLKDYLNHKIEDFDTFMRASFVWDDTPQKYLFWEKIANRTKPVK